MKKIIVLLSIVLLFPGIALAEWVNIYPGASDDQVVVFTTDDSGETRTSTVYKTSDNTYIEYDDRGNSRLINDFSGSGWGDRRDRD